jgi:hypothetical protein
MRDYIVVVKVASGEHAVHIRAISEEAVRRLWGARIISIGVG